MSVSATRVRAIYRKELREYRRNRSIVATMAVIPLIFVLFPLIEVLALPASAASAFLNGDPLVILLGIPALVPTVIAAFSVAGEREQGTLEPVLTTPVRREEFLLGKALAVFVPTIAIAYVMFGIFLAAVGLFAHQNVVTDVFKASRILPQVLFTPLLAGWSIWAAIAISAKVTDVRVAQQLGTLVSLPPLAVTSLMGFGVIKPSIGLALGLGAALLVIDLGAWRVVSMLFDRERLITGTKA